MNAATAREIATRALEENIKTEDSIYLQHKAEVLGSLVERIETDARHGGFGKYFNIYPGYRYCSKYDVRYIRSLHRRLVKDLRMIFLARGFRISHWPWIFNSSDARIWIGW